LKKKVEEIEKKKEKTSDVSLKEGRKKLEGKPKEIKEKEEYIYEEDKPIKVEPLTEREKIFISECGYAGPADVRGEFEIEEEAIDWSIIALNILLKSNWKNIPCYYEEANSREIYLGSPKNVLNLEEKAKCLYYDDIAILISIVSSRNDEEVFNLILKAVKERPEIGVFTETAKEFTSYPEKKDIIVLILEDFMKVKNPRYPPAEDRLKVRVAYALFYFGENDIALNYVEEFLKRGDDFFIKNCPLTNGFFFYNRLKF